MDRRPAAILGDASGLNQQPVEGLRWATWLDVTICPADNAFLSDSLSLETSDVSTRAFENTSHSRASNKTVWQKSCFVRFETNGKLQP
jgi:hypothetical protein